MAFDDGLLAGDRRIDQLSDLHVGEQDIGAQQEQSCVVGKKCWAAGPGPFEVIGQADFEVVVGELGVTDSIELRDEVVGVLDSAKPVQVRFHRGLRRTRVATGERRHEEPASDRVAETFAVNVVVAEPDERARTCRSRW